MALHTTTHRPPFSTPPLSFPPKPKSRPIPRYASPAASSASNSQQTMPFMVGYWPLRGPRSPELAEAETEKFRAGLLKMLLKEKEKESFGDDLDSVVQVCVEIFNKFLHKECGGPGTLLVEPMMIALKERNLAGAPLAVLGHHCYGLKTMLIKIGKFGTQNHPSN
ncbi:hypothetical protein TorRG33x02_051220 [Trema orientale]|uniref:Uncharacterized protein n=1 Tax=Trema orientale TaxID=63057 RepID=A0A2P5FM59_TREOI|nr:hypothetical protein TorRG33x02_051220 [Trema orientale]